MDEDGDVPCYNPFRIAPYRIRSLWLALLAIGLLCVVDARPPSVGVGPD